MTIKKTSTIIITTSIVAVLLVFIIYNNLNVLIINKEVRAVKSAKLISPSEWKKFCKALVS